MQSSGPCRGSLGDEEEGGREEGVVEEEDTEAPGARAGTRVVLSKSMA